MGNLEINIKRKKNIGRISIYFFIIIILLTFFSKTINNYMLPEVEVIEPLIGSLEHNFNTEGKVLIEKESFFSMGNWRVIDIPAKIGQEVKVGDLLLKLDTKDLEIDLKEKELEIIKLENNISKYIYDHKSYDLFDIVKNINMAEREIHIAEEKMNEMELLFNNGIETKTNLEQAKRLLEDAKLEYKYKKELYDKKIFQKEEEEKSYNNILNEKRIELELKKMELEQFKKETPLNGEIRSTLDGKVVSINIEKGQNTLVNQNIFEIVKNDSPCKIIWELNSEKASLFEVNEEVKIVLKGELKDSNEYNNNKKSNLTIEEVVEMPKISRKVYINNSNKYEYEAVIYNSKIKIYDGQQVQVFASKTSEIYDTLLPNSSLIEKNGKNYIYTINKRKSALGVEMYINEINVDIIDSDDFNTAINGLLERSNKVVVTSTKPLTNGLQVKLR